ncbi:XRE family transcriptional regulator [Nannocystis pusilla]|uniref:XRE family transcriptional regulator n=1 Tax=Nannocystis pusilla TaxID=889268 RepID=A0A9X3F272_9BACT|nr:XRE family transcriptional regulator [Nannocystis pusilla]
MSAARDAVARVLRAHEPYPALVFDRRWNIVMTNRAVDPFFAHVAPDLLRPPVNLVRLGLDPRGLASLVVNLTDVRAVFRSRIARQLAAAPDAELLALYELLASDPEEAPGRTVESNVVLPMIVRVDGRELRLFSTITTFGTPMDITLDEIAIESYYPADEETPPTSRAPAVDRSGPATRAGPTSDGSAESSDSPEWRSISRGAGSTRRRADR